MSDPQSRPRDSVAIERGKRRFFRNTAFSFGHQVVTMLTALLLLPFMLWRLGPEKYGLWLTLQIFSMSGLVSLAELGFQSSIVRYLVKYHTENRLDEFRRLLVTSFALFAAIGILISSSIILVGHEHFIAVFNIPAAFRVEMLTAFCVQVGGLAIGFPILALKAFYSGTQKLGMLKSWEAGERLVFALLAVPLLFITDRILPVVLLEQAVIATAFLSFLVLGRVRFREIFSINPKYASLQSLRRVAGMSGLVFLNSASWLVYLKIPDIVIGAVLGPVHLAYYTIINRIPRALKAFQGSVNSAVMPFAVMLDSVDGGAEAKKSLVLKGMRFSFLVFVPISAIVLIYAEELLTLWVGQRYAFLGDQLRLFMLWQLTAFLVSFGGATFTKAEHYRRVVGLNFLVNVTFLILMFALIYPYQLNGVLAALLVTGLATTAITFNGIRHANGFSYGSFAKTVLLGPILFSLVLGLALLGGAKAAWTRIGFEAGSAAFLLAGLLYLCALLFFVLTRQERELLAKLPKWRRKQAPFE